MKLNIDFARSVQIYSYIIPSDIISEIGGLKSAIDPIFGLAIPILILNWLIGFARIIQVQHKQNYILMLIKIIRFHFNELKEHQTHIVLGKNNKFL